MPLADLVALFKAQHWLPLILTLTLIARRWTSPDSKFPINVAPQWRPTITALGGLAYGLESSLSQGMSWGMAILGAFATAGAGGFADGLLIAIFNKNNAPKWAKAIVFVFDDLTGASSGLKAAKATDTSSPPAEPPQKAISMKPPVPPTMPPTAAAMIVATAACLSLSALAGCAAVQSASSLPSDVAGAVGCVIADLISGKPITDCVDKWGPALVNDAINILLHSPVFAAEHPELLPKLQAHHVTMTAMVPPASK